ncbi:MAG: hypothetical protein V1833_01360 [Elusimicrobiota bacterium]
MKNKNQIFSLDDVFLTPKKSKIDKLATTVVVTQTYQFFNDFFG